MERTENIAFYFGSFNPITNSHLIVAKKTLKNTDIDRVIFVLTPQNPEKTEKELENSTHRANMILRAIEDQEQMELDLIECHSLERPLYTYKTVEALEKKYKNSNLHILIGEDVYENIRNWDHFERLLGKNMIVFPRKKKLEKPIKVRFKKDDIDILKEYKEIELPNEKFLCSATDVRNMIEQRKDITRCIPKRVEQYIQENELYKR